jgi:hypothetical protein
MIGQMILVLILVVRAKQAARAVSASLIIYHVPSFANVMKLHVLIEYVLARYSISQCSFFFCLEYETTII